MNFIIPFQIYPFDVMVSLNQDWDQFGRSVIKKWDSDILEDFKKAEHPNTQGYTYLYSFETELCCIIKIDRFKKDAHGYGTLQHEIFHAVEFVLRRCGLVLNENSFEAYAYAIGYLTTEIYKKL